MNRKLEWIILITDRFLKSRKFYKEILELKIVRESVKEEFVQFQMENCFLAIYGRKEMERLVGKKYFGKKPTAVYSFAEVEDVDKEYNQLKQKGVTFIKKPVTQPWGQRTAYFFDPDGNIWEIQKWTR